MMKLSCFGASRRYRCERFFTMYQSGEIYDTYPSRYSKHILIVIENITVQINKINDTKTNQNKSIFSRPTARKWDSPIKIRMFFLPKSLLNMEEMVKPMMIFVVYLFVITNTETESDLIR